MGSLLGSQEFLLKLHATVMSPKQNGRPAIRPVCRRPFQRWLLCGYGDLFTSRVAVESLSSLSFAKKMFWYGFNDINYLNKWKWKNKQLPSLPCMRLLQKWLLFREKGSIKLNPLTHCPIVMNYFWCSYFAGVTTTQQCICPLPASCFCADESFWKNMINSFPSNHSLWHRTDDWNSRRGRWRQKDSENDEREEWIWEEEGGGYGGKKGSSG